MSAETDWLSAACSIIAAIIGLITLVTVYVAARQLLTEHWAYRMGLSEQCLGPWHSTVKTKRKMGMQQQICTPTITLPSLLKNHWEAGIKFPMGFVPKIGDPEMGLATSGWVNFVEALGLSPGDRHLYQMRVQSNLVNGIIPMRWTGKDLVAICSILGFQSYEETPSFKDPMPLPMQWSGPLGWMQFRASSDGCVVEYRRRRVIADQLSSELQEFYDALPTPKSEYRAHSRLWQSISGICLKNGNVLYLGGANRDSAQQQLKQLMDEAKGLGKGGEGEMTKLKELLERMKEVLETPGAFSSTKDPQKSMLEDDALFDEFIAGDISGEDMTQTLRNGRATKLREPETDSTVMNDADSEKAGRKKMDKKSIVRMALTPCKGLFSTIVEGELANSRGLNIADCVEYHRRLLINDDVDEDMFPYNLGDLYMDQKLLRYMKEAVEQLKPDGYFFTPTKMLYSDVTEVYEHVENISRHKDRVKIFPQISLGDIPDTCKGKRELYHAMLLCNEFHHIQKYNEAAFTIPDMVLTAKASKSLHGIIGEATDLVWALLVCPTLFSDLAQALERLENHDLLNQTITCKKEMLDCTRFIESCGIPDAAAQMIYKVPLCSDGEFTSIQLLAAFMDVMITNFWISEKWISDVALYDVTIPQTITMC